MIKPIYGSFFKIEFIQETNSPVTTLSGTQFSVGRSYKSNERTLDLSLSMPVNKDILDQFIDPTYRPDILLKSDAPDNIILSGKSYTISSCTAETDGHSDTGSIILTGVLKDFTINRDEADFNKSPKSKAKVKKKEKPNPLLPKNIFHNSLINQEDNGF